MENPFISSAFFTNCSIEKLEKIKGVHTIYMHYSNLNIKVGKQLSISYSFFFLKIG